MAKGLFLCTVCSACLLDSVTQVNSAGSLAASEIAFGVISMSASVHIASLMDWVGSHANVDSDPAGPDHLESSLLVMAASWIGFAVIDCITSLTGHPFIRPGSPTIAWGMSSEG